MSKQIIKIENFKIENVKISSPRANSHGGKVVYVNYDFEDGSSPKPLRIQLKRMRVPFGISAWDQGRSDKKNSEPSETSNDSIDLAFKENQENVVEIFEKIEELAIKHATNNSVDFFKKKHDPATVKVFFKSNIKYSEDEEGKRDNKYQPRLKTKLLKDSSYSYKTQIYDNDNKRVDFDIYNQSSVIPKGSECLSIVECGNIWIINEKFGISWRPAQMKIFKNDLALTECAFEEDPEEVVELKKSIEELDLFDDDELVEEEPVLKKKTTKSKK